MAKKNRRFVVLTNTSRGVYFGELEGPDPKSGESALLHNMRHCFSWTCFDDTKGVWGLALRGPASGSRIGPTLPKFRVYNVAGIAECTPEAVENWVKATWA